MDQKTARSREILDELLDESIQVDINENQISVDDEHWLVQELVTLWLIK